MIKKIKLGLLVVVLSLAVVGIANAAALDLVWSVDQTVNFSSPSMDLTIKSGSTASSLAVNDGSMVATLALGDIFTALTPTAGSFTVSPETGATIKCNTDHINTVIITATGSQAYTITPSTTPCVYVSTGFGSGGGSSYVPPVVAPVTPVLVPEQPVAPVGSSVAGCENRTTGFSTIDGKSCVGNNGVGSSVSSKRVYDFGTVTLKNGSKGEAVKELQRFLNDTMNLGLVVDGKLGPKTVVVIKQWQKDHGLVADGLVGKKTKIMMNASVQ